MAGKIYYGNVSYTIPTSRLMEFDELVEGMNLKKSQAISALIWHLLDQPEPEKWLQELVAQASKSAKNLAESER